MKQEKLASSLGIDKIVDVVAKVRLRLYCRTLLESACSSFLFAFCAAVVYVAIGSVCEPLRLSPRVVVYLTLAIGCAATIASFLSNKLTRYETEKAIDAKYELDDRFLTAGELLEQTRTREANDFELLQLQDCVERARNVDPRQVVSIKPRQARMRAALLLVSVAALAFVLWRPNAGEVLAKTPNETSLSVSRELRDNVLAPLRELVDSNPNDAELRALSEKLQALVDEFDENNDDPKKGAALVAQMENEIKAVVTNSGVERTDKSLKELGDAFGSIESGRSVANALTEGDYDKAADELEKLDFEKMSLRDRQALADKLKAAAEVIRSRKDEQTAQLTEQLADELQSGKCASCKNTACKMAGSLRKQKCKQDVVKQLNCQLARLGLCKSNCAGACSTCTANCPSKSQQKDANGQKQTGNQKTNGQATGDGKRPTGSTGLASDPLSGSDSQIDTTKTLTRVSGKEGKEGVSSIETAKANEGQAAVAQRERDEKEREYVKQIEAALDDDNVPFERRRIVRAYFEGIRAESENRTPSGE